MYGERKSCKLDFLLRCIRVCAGAGGRVHSGGAESALGEKQGVPTVEPSHNNASFVPLYCSPAEAGVVATLSILRLARSTVLCSVPPLHTPPAQCHGLLCHSTAVHGKIGGRIGREVHGRRLIPPPNAMLKQTRATTWPHP